MSFNGSGTFVINSSGQPVVTGTVISSTVFNAFTADVATGLSTTICKDGQTTVTAAIPFATNRLTGVGAATARTDAIQYAQVQDGSATYLTSPSGTNTITATAANTMAAYAAGQEFTFIPANTNTGATTLNINSIGAKNVFFSGAACIGGEIKQSVPCRVQYDGTQFNIIGPALTLTGSFTCAVTGGATGTVTVHWAKIGKFVCLTYGIGQTGNSSNSQISYANTNFPAALYPSRAVRNLSINNNDNGSGVAGAGLALLGTTGTLQVFKDGTGAAFTSSASATGPIADFTISYTLD